MTWTSRAVVASLAALTCATTVRAQESFEFVGDRQTAMQLSQIIESVRSRGLPVDPVIAKARRAVQVHAPAPRLLAAAQAVAKRLETARDALGPAAPPADVAAGEDALSINGVTGEMLQTVRAAQPTRSIAVPLGVMAQLVATGVAPNHAAEIVSRLIRGGATNAQLVALGNDVNQDVTGGANAMTSLNVRLETLKPLLAHVPPPIPAQAVQTTAPFTGPKRPRP